MFRAAIHANRWREGQGKFFLGSVRQEDFSTRFTCKGQAAIRRNRRACPRIIAPNYRWTVKLTVITCIKLPEVPLIRIENVPIDALSVADKVSVLVPVVLSGMKDAATPRGRPAADKLTLPVNPF